MLNAYPTMKMSLMYIRTLAATTLVSGVLALLCLALSGIALADNPEAFSDPMRILDSHNLNVALLRWSMLADMFGYYLLLLPAIYYLHAYLRQQTPWADLITFCGTAYVLIGAIGAVLMAEVATPMISDYMTAAPDQQLQIRLGYQMITRIVYNGLWNLLETLIAGAWWLLTGYFLLPFHKPLAWTTLVLGAFTFLDGLGNLIGSSLLAEIGLNVYLILAPVWAIWLGIVLWQQAPQASSAKSYRLLTR